MENKYLTKYVGKGTDELTDTKKAVVVIRRKGLYNFEDQYKGQTGWLKLDSEFLKTTFSKIHSEFYKERFEKNNEDQDMELYTTIIVPFDK